MLHLKSFFEWIISTGEPLLMNSPSQMVMLIGGFAALVGSLGLFAYFCERFGVPVTGDSLGIFLNDNR